MKNYPLRIVEEQEKLVKLLQDDKGKEAGLRVAMGTFFYISKVTGGEDERTYKLTRDYREYYERLPKLSEII